MSSKLPSVPVVTGVLPLRNVSPLSRNITPGTGMVLILYSTLPDKRVEEVLTKSMPLPTASAEDRVTAAVETEVLL